MFTGLMAFFLKIWLSQFQLISSLFFKISSHLAHFFPKKFFSDFGSRHKSILYHSQGGVAELRLCDPDREFGIYILT